MITLKMNNFNMILIEKLEKYQPYHHAKQVNMNILQVNNYCLLLPNKYCLLIIEKTKFTYSLLVKAFKEKKKKKKKIKDQGQKQIKAIQNQRQVKTIKKYTYNDKAH